MNPTLLNKSLLITTLFCLTFYSNLSAQCTATTLASGACSGGNGLLGNNQTINSGQTFWYNTTGNRGNVTMNGGTLRVCGNLTLSSLSFNSNNINVIVEAGATLTINSGFNMNGSTNITNYGNISVSGGINIQNGNNFIVNSGINSSFSSSSSISVNDNTSRILNQGSFTVGTLTLQSQAQAGALCLAGGSSFQAATLNNNAANSVSASGGSGACQAACLHITSSISYQNVALSNSGNALILCLATGATTNGSGNAGNARVVTGCSGCTNALTTYPTNNQPSVTISNSGTSLCTGQTTRTLTANATTPSGTITGYQWTLGGANISGANASTYVATAGGTYNVIVTNSNGCTGSAASNTVITGNAAPTAAITVTENSGATANDGTICAGSSVQLTASGGTTYTWSGAAVGTPANNPQNILPSATGGYRVTVTDANGCTASTPTTITVNTIPSPTITVAETSGTANDGTICNGSSVTLTASGGGSYTWSNSGGTLASAVFSPTVTTNYSVTVTNNGCSAIVSRSITVSSISTAISIAETSGTANNDGTTCSGASVTLTATNGTTYSWSNGGGSLAVATFNPTTTTTYSVTATNALNCSAVATRAISVNANPTASIVISEFSGTANDGTVCASSPVTLSANGGTTYVWTPTGATTASITDNPSSTTTYNVTVRNTNGCTATATSTITTIVCGENCSNNIDDDGDGLIDGYDSDCSNACFTGLNNGFESPVLSAATYLVFDISTLPGWSTTASDNQVELWSTGFQGVTAYEGSQFAELNANLPGTLIKELNATAGAAVNIAFAHRGRSGVDVMQVSIGPVGGPFVTLGTFSDGTTGWGYYTLPYTMPSSGAYQLRFVPISTATGSLSVGNFLDAVTVATGSPVANFAPNNASACINNPRVTLTNTSVAGSGTITSYSWNFGTGATPATATTAGPHEVTYNSVGTRTVSVTVTNSNGCTSSRGSIVTVNSNPILSLTGPTQTCPGQAITLNANATAGTGSIVSYGWNNGGGNASSATVAPTVNTTYEVTVTNSVGCKTEASQTVTVINAGSQVYLATNSTNQTNLVLTCESNGWSYYADPSNTSRYLFAINWNPNGGVLGNASQKAAAQVTINVSQPLSSPLYGATLITGQTPAQSYYQAVDPASHQGTFVMRRYWNVDVGGGSLPEAVNIKFYFDPAEYNTIVNAATQWSLANGGYVEGPKWFKTIAATDGLNNSFNPNTDISPVQVEPSGWVIPLTPATNGTENSVTYVQFDGIASFSGGTIAVGVGNGSVLPVELIYFAGRKEQNTSQLYWATETEQNCAYFEVERSHDGISFENIGRVTGNGTTNERHDYIFTDEHPYSGNNYYRLRQVDYDNTSNYTHIINLKFGEDAEAFAVQVYPNPIESNMVINFQNAIEGDIRLEVFDIQGRLLEQTTLTTSLKNGAIDFNTNSWAGGVYIVKITNGTNQSVHKITKSW